MAATSVASARSYEGPTDRGTRTTVRGSTDSSSTPRGNRRTVRRGGFPTQKEAGPALDAAKGKAAKGADVTRRLTVGDHLAGWLDAKANIRPTTRRSYAQHIEQYLVPHMGRRGHPDSGGLLSDSGAVRVTPRRARSPSRHRRTTCSPPGRSSDARRPPAGRRMGACETTPTATQRRGRSPAPEPEPMVFLAPNDAPAASRRPARTSSPARSSQAAGAPTGLLPNVPA
jgi:hypothetical protein